MSRLCCSETNPNFSDEEFSQLVASLEPKDIQHPHPPYVQQMAMWAPPNPSYDDVKDEFGFSLSEFKSQKISLGTT